VRDFAFAEDGGFELGHMGGEDRLVES
jgi:hypothetical protein